MVQRIQSLWLLLAAVATGLTFYFPIYFGKLNEVVVVNASVQQLNQNVNAGYNLALTALTIVIALLALFTLFTYKNRKKQLTLCTINILLTVGLGYLYYYYINKDFAEGAITIKSVFLFIIPVMLLLAIRGILRDIKLLKSIDRLR